MKDLAKPELDELRRLTIGKVAPEIEGEDLDGQPMKLSSYRGKVVVLTFWWLDYTEAPDHRKLVERMAGKPFAFIGVYCDDDLARGKAEVEKYGITWPSFRDKRDGPITKNWNVRSWPNVWVLDRRGVIRYRDVRWARPGRGRGHAAPRVSRVKPIMRAWETHGRTGQVCRLTLRLSFGTTLP